MRAWKFFSRAGKALPLDRVQIYLEQLAAALDYAHARDILHRDIKTSNILLALGGEVLLTDFGLGGLTVEQNFARARRAVPGMLDAIAPEYVLGQASDQRADLYSLGVVLYQMVTGLAPFQGNSLGEVAMQHVKAAPPSPCSLRADLPRAAEQVILRALAKNPADRYSHAGDLASGFRLALDTWPARTSPGESQKTNALDMLADLASGKTTAARLSAPRRGGLFDPKWQTQELPLATGEQQKQEPGTDTTSPQSALSALFKPLISPVEEQPGDAPSQAQASLVEITGQTSPGTQPSSWANDPGDELSALPPTPRVKGLKRAKRFRPGAQSEPLGQDQATLEPGAPGSVQVAAASTGNTEALQFAPQSMGNPTRILDSLATVPGTGDTSGTIKLTEPVKIVQVPVAGQPGHFVTGFLPVMPQAETAVRARHTRMKIASLFLVLLLVATGSGIFLVARGQNSPAATSNSKSTPNVAASEQARAAATASANIILSDTLNQNINNWPVGQQGWFTCSFANNAYDITNSDKNRSASALLQKVISGPFAYSLTMEQIKGDTTSQNNQFGMILYATVQNIKGKQIDQFYTLEVLNRAGGQYQFWKYDNSKSGSPWHKLWSKKFGKEFLQGSGPSHVNTLKVVASASLFTFIVNGNQVGTLKDSSFSSGNVGMLVNLDGAEVAFSNFLLTHF